MSKNERTGIDKTVFGVSLGLIALLIAAGAARPDLVGQYANAAMHWIVVKAGWVLVLSAAGFVVFALWLAFSRFGRIPLAQNGEEPDFSRVSWLAMMFSAGMGIGLVFFAVAEPVAHLMNPAPWLSVTPGTGAAARLAMGYTLFHWGLQPWAIYGVVALAIAYSTFRKGRKNLLSAPFQSLIRDEDTIAEDTWWGKAINIWGIIATKIGGATSLGLGALQIAAGLLVLVGGIGAAFGEGAPTRTWAFPVIFVLVFFALLSAVSGVSKGIKWLSNTNMVVAIVLALFVVAIGPTAYILNLLPEAFGAYLDNIVAWSFRTTAFGGDTWMSNWTIFYWAWWISWAPFVSTFIARVSKGRTIREFVIGVLVVPTVVSALWFVVFGGAGTYLQMTGAADIASAAGPAATFFAALAAFPFFSITAGAVVFLVAIFWISGADANALVLAILSSHGNTEPNKWLIALWAVLSSVVAAVLLYVGGLGALQTFTVLVAAPLVLVIIGLCVGLCVDLLHDPLRGEPNFRLRRPREAAGEGGLPEAGRRGARRGPAPGPQAGPHRGGVPGSGPAARGQRLRRR